MLNLWKFLPLVYVTLKCTEYSPCQQEHVQFYVYSIHNDTVYDIHFVESEMVSGMHMLW